MGEVGNHDVLCCKSYQITDKKAL